MCICVIVFYTRGIVIPIGLRPSHGFVACSLGEQPRALPYLVASHPPSGSLPRRRGELPDLLRRVTPTPQARVEWYRTETPISLAIPPGLGKRTETRGRSLILALVLASATALPLVPMG